MATFTRFEEIEAWKIARELTNSIYKMTNEKTFSRDYALKDQIRRAAISIMSNIAEGYGRRTNPEFIRFLNIANASAFEVKCQLYIAIDQGYIGKELFKTQSELCNSICRKIGALTNYLRTQSS